MNKAGIIVVDNHQLFRSGLKFLIEAENQYKVIGEAKDGHELLDMLKNLSPDLVIMDISKPGLNGIEATRLALLKYPSLKILILSMYGEPQHYNSLIDLGIKGYLLKDTDKTEFFQAIKRIIDGETYFSQQLLIRILNEKTVTIVKLSQREQVVLDLISHGLSNHEIAAEMNLSQRTIERHRTKLLDKTGCKNSIHLVLFALKNKLISL